MVKSNMPMRGEPGATETSSLAALSRTLEALEIRLAKLGDGARPSLSRTPEQAHAALFGAAPSSLAGSPAISSPAEHRRGLSDAVSEIVMRRQVLDTGPSDAYAILPQAARPPQPFAPRTEPAPVKRPALGPEAQKQRSEATEHRFRTLADDAETLRAQDGNYALMAEVAEELQRLRQEIQSGGSSRSDPRFDAMRRAFDDLREMIETRASADVIGTELAEVSDTLARLTEEGADRATLNTLRAELEEMRGQFGQMARETTVNAVGRRWDEFETRHAAQAERDTEAKHDLKHELERLRESLRTLASEDQVRAVERRWDEFETRYLDSDQARAEPAISQLLRDELEGMREKLDGIAEAAPFKAVEERWDSLEEKLDSREVEASIQHLSDRMGEIESVLARLPESLGLAPLEGRLQSLAVSVDALAQRSENNDLDHFVALEERLDEISRAIVATSLQAQPVLDMAPIERIEARIAMLTARVDRFTDEGEAQMLSARIAELSDRVEELAENPVADQLATRMASLTERLESAFAAMEQPSIDVSAIEARLSALALRLEDAVQPQVDPGILGALEAQIARLSEHLASIGTSSAGDLDPEFDRRLAAVERRLDDNREALIAAAREAAEETARRMEASGDSRQSEHVAQLSENLRALEAFSRESDGRSNQVFDAVHSTLLKIVDRLEQIETDVNRDARPEPRDAVDDARIERAAAHLAAAAVGTTSAARVHAGAGGGMRGVLARHLPGRPAPEEVAAGAQDTLLDRLEPEFGRQDREQVEAPSLDTSDMIDRSEANRPLEPGSGAPDIGALLERVRLKQRTMASAGGEATGAAATVAAANRAARAAAAEAEKLRSPSEAGTPSNKKLSLRELVSRRRKTVLACVAAVLAVLAVLPIKTAFFPDDAGAPDGTPVLQSADKSPARLSAAGSETGVVPPPAAPPASASASRKPPLDEPAAKTGGTASQGVADAKVKTPFSAFAKAPATAAPVVPDAGPLAPAPAVASAPAPAAKTADPSAVLVGAIAKLPASDGGIPAVPAGIGSPALVKAAAAGDPKALFEIGLRLMEGRGSDPKPAEAFNWFAEAGKRGFAPAQYSLGTLFEKGNGVARDVAAARDWYLVSALQGNVRAMHNLAVLYATGIDGKSEPETAAKWFKDAADHGMRDSQYNLGILYAQGSGVDLDMAQSYKWFAIVAKSGDKDAEAKRDEVAKRLAPDVLAAAQASVANWTEQPRPEEANTVELPKDWSDAKSDQTASIDMTRVVRNIQAILGKLGYDVGTPDGVAGGKTRTAIMAFQKEAGLKADGAINEALVRALLQRKNG